MSADLMVDTTRLHQAAVHLDEAVTDFRRAADEPAVAAVDCLAFGPGGAGVEAAAQLVRRLRQGAECAQLLARRSARLAAGLRVAAAEFGATESTLAGGPR